MSTSDSPPSSSTERVALAAPKPFMAPVYPGLGRRLSSEVEIVKGGLLHDEKGRPLVFSAREISPGQDNPLFIHERIGEWLFWRTLPNGGRFPRNVRHSVVLYYLLGRGRGRWWDLLLMPMLPLLVFGWLDIHVLVLSMRGGWLPSLGEALFVSVAAPLVMGIWAQWMAHRAFHRVEGRMQIETLAVTRITPADIVYALAAWPASHLHLAAALLLVESLVSVGLMVLGAIEIAINATAVDEIAVVGAFLAAFCLLRWLLFMLAINIGIATVVRNRLLLRHGASAVFRSARELVFSAGGFLTLTFVAPILLTLSSYVMGCFGPILLGPLLLLWWSSSLYYAVGRAANIFTGLVGNWRSWSMSTGLDAPADHRVLSDDW